MSVEWMKLSHLEEVYSKFTHVGILLLKMKGKPDAACTKVGGFIKPLFYIKKNQTQMMEQKGAGGRSATLKGEEINEELYTRVCDSISDSQICSVCTQLINPEYSVFGSDL